MEFPAASAHRGLVPWLGLLLAVFPCNLAIWIPPTVPQISIVSTFAAEGQDVTLRTRNSPPGVVLFMWYRGMEMKYSKLIGFIPRHLNKYIRGPQYSGRETANLDGTLIIRNVTPRDQGLYIVIALLQNSQGAVGYGWLSVYRPVSVPTILASRTTVTENEDAVVMTCYTDANSTSWLFNAQRLHLRKRMKLSPDQKTLTIDPVRRGDAGNYQCQVSNPISCIESAPIELDVKYQ